MELIPSKDVRNYLAEIEKGFTDFEKAALSYNSENKREDIIAELKKLQAETKDERLIQQIEERFQHDEEVLNSLRKADENTIFLLEIYEPEDEQYYRCGCYSSFEAAKGFADTIGRAYKINRLRLHSENEILKDEEEAEGELGYIAYDEDGSLYDWWMRGESEEWCSNDLRFEDAYITMPHPFKKGDIVRDIRTGEFGIVYVKENWKTEDDYVKKGNADFSAVQVRVDICDEETGEFGHQHICPIYLEFAPINNMMYSEIKEPFDNMLKAAQDLVRGDGAIDDFQYCMQRYLNYRKRKEGK